MSLRGFGRHLKAVYSPEEGVAKAFFEILFDYILMHVPEAKSLSLWERDTFGNKFKV